MKAFVSIIVPIYNVEAYISECLLSLCSQTLKNIEIICVNDVSLDNSMAIVKKIAATDDRIIIIEHTANKGLSATRNTGLSVATGEYVGFVDSDDFVSHNFYEKLYTNAVKHNADIAQSYITLFYDKDNTTSGYSLNNAIKNFDSRNKKIQNLEMYYISGMCPNKIYKRNLIQEHAILFPENLYWEDNPFVLKATYFAKTIIPVPEATYYYRQRLHSIVRLGNKKLHFDLLKSSTIILTFLNEISLSPKEYIHIFSLIINRILDEYKRLSSNIYVVQYRQEFVDEFFTFFEKRKYKEELKKEYKKLFKKIKKNTGLNLIRNIYDLFKYCIEICYYSLKIFSKICLLPVFLLLLLRGYKK